MSTQIETREREVDLLEDAHIRLMMGLDVLEPLPSRTIPYAQVDPFILVHEAVVPITPERASMDTKHPHRGFDNLWYLLAGEASTGHSTGPGGAMERARLQTGSLLKLRTGSGVWHAEGIGEDELREGKSGTEMRGVLFWVNLARKYKGVEPSAQLLNPHDVPVRQVGEAIVRVLVGEGSPVELGTPGLILDVELPGAESSAARSRLSSTASCTCWKERQASAPTHGGRAARRLPFSERVARLRWSMRSPGRASCSWPESRTERCPTSTDRTWTDGRRQLTSVARPNSSMRVPAGTRP